LGRAVERRSLPRVAPAELFLAGFSLALTLIYISSLPLHAQVTVRYLFPVSPVLAVLVVRLPPIRRALDEHWRTMLWSTAAGVLIGGQFVLVALATLDVGRGEAFQFHAVLALGVAALLAAWVVIGWTTDVLDRVGAVLFGLATASTAVFVCFAALAYYGLGGSHALPMMRVLGELLPVG